MVCRRIAFLLLLLLSPWPIVDAKKNIPDPALEAAKHRNRTIERLVELRTHSIQPPYIDQDLQNRWWDFGADAYVNTNEHIRLTRAVPSQTGWLWSRLPLTAPNFEIVVYFKISGDSSHLYGDGMAMWISTTRAEPGPIYGSVDLFNGLGIIIDTYANSAHNYGMPRVLAAVGDGHKKFDLEHDGEGSSLGACSPHIRRTNVGTKLKLRYMKEDGWLNLQIQYKAWDEWTDCFTVYNVTLPSNPYIGFSALTGDVSDNHDIISVQTSVAYLSPLSSPKDRIGTTPSGEPGSVSTGGGFIWWFLKWTFIAGLIYVVYVAYVVYIKDGGNGDLGGGRAGPRVRLGAGGRGIQRELGRFAARFDTKRF